MKKRNKIVYWIATIWLSLGMVSTGVVQLIREEESVKSFQHLGYPGYLLTILGVWKLLGVATILGPRQVLLKEWAYAGFFFLTSGAAMSHIIMQDRASEILPSVLLLVLTIISWYFRPDDRKISTKPR